MALRGEAGDGFTVDGEDVMNEVLATREAMGAFADALRSNGRIKDVVNIGIGGSDLGPLGNESLAQSVQRRSKSPLCEQRRRRSFGIGAGRLDTRVNPVHRSQ